MNNCIIYGGGGFIGSHLCEELLKRNYNVTIFDKINFAKDNIKNFKDKIKVIEGDFNNEYDLLSSLDGIDYVYHLVSSTLPASSNDNPVYDVESNLISTLRLLQDVVKRKIKKVIFVSSGGTVYGIPKAIPIPEDHSRQPICSYGITKKTIEDYLYMFSYLYNLDYTVFRLANPYGERQNPLYAQGVIPVFLKKILLKEEIVIWGDGSVRRDYIYIKDAIMPLVNSLEHKSEYKVFNLGSGEGYSVNELLEMIKKVTNMDAKVKYVAGRKLDVPVSVLDISLLKKEMNYAPKIEIEKGIEITYNYLKEVLL
ncbi:MAG: NAD-dependent epimerase/dehydratase family protein [Ignavibacteriota bacterium]|nr:NAD-dependent epimerase/dehydratase family protein [Ignavibacteriota bacterium]